MSDNRNNSGDHTQWSNARMTGVGLTIAGGVAAAFGSVLYGLIDRRRRPVRYVSARVLREQAERGAEIVRLERNWLEARLSYAGVEVAERDREIARLQEDNDRLRLREHRARQA